MDGANINGLIILGLVVIFFVIVMLSGRKLKEYAVYTIDGDIYHLWRRQQNWWFDWGGEMIFYERDGVSRVIIEKHYVKRYKELKKGDWEIISEDIAKEKTEK